ncbi:MAG: HD domain-containing protein [Dehalococcoidales bacterium]|jgi:poly(A) polymerase|nr:HD domain-containing protein [Dehalococcoidales bacterium]MDX9986973.1 HD domain-containing protein [Dehalococcoidales bacterium]
MNAWWGLNQKNSRLLTRVEAFFSQSAGSAFLVGGYLRDCILGRTPEDIDLAISSDALITAPALAEFINGHFVVLDSKNHIARIVLPEDYQPASTVKHLDINTIRDDILYDLARRDFTINAMALPIEKANDLVPGATVPELIDPYQGIDAISRRTISAVSPQVFKNDGIRLLRCVRLSQELGFKIDGDTLSLLKENSDCIRGIAGERVREELLRLFKIDNTGDVIIQLDKLGILEGIIPELIPCKTTQQPKEHHWDVFGHSVKCIDAVDYLLRKGNWPYAASDARKIAPWNNHIQNYFEYPVAVDSNRRQILKIAALLHDIAKPDTRTITEDGRIRFYGHPAHGEPITQSILTRLRFSIKETRMAAGMTLHHLRPVQMNQKGQLPTSRAIYRYLRDTGDIAIDTLFLSLADHLAARGPTLEAGFWAEHCRIADMVIGKKEAMEESTKAPSLINGHDLLDNFNLAPGPIIRAILEAVAEAQAVGDITTRGEALKLVGEIIGSKDLPMVDNRDYRQGKGIIKP